MTGSDTEMSDRSTSTDTTDKEWELTELLVIDAMNDYDRKYFCKQPYRNDPFSGKEYVVSVLNGYDDRCPDLFRMKKNVLYDLSDALRDRGLLHETCNISVEEQLCIFLYTIGHNETNRNVADRFQHSGETISRYFATVLKAICKFSKEVINPPNFNNIHPYIMSKGDKYYPWFQNCIGAIDGTHVSASVPSGKKQIPYRGRKTLPTQNVMCVCDFDMCFTFVLAGWEGTANDARIFREALSNEDLNFPHPPEGKYYVVDSGYANAPEFLAPYKGERYHLNDYRGRDRLPRNTKEKFNYAHSSLRNVIERSFGVLKARFPILKMMPPYSLRKQRNIVIATCALHNFIRKHALQDDMFVQFGRDDIVIPGESDNKTPQTSTRVDMTQRRQEMGTMRDEICRNMAIHYGLSY